jgi:hypothetical protein
MPQISEVEKLDLSTLSERGQELTDKRSEAAMEKRRNSKDTFFRIASPAYRRE